MHVDFNLPISWSAEDADSDKAPLPTINSGDHGLIAIIRAASELNTRDQGLALVILQAIAAWSGLQAGLGSSAA